MATNYSNLLDEHVSHAKTSSDLFTLSNSLNVNLLPTIQSILKEKLCDLDPDTERSICFNFVSMDAIFPAVVIQHILSFTDSLDMKYVNKTFKKCYDINMNIQLRKRQSIIDNETFIPNIPYSKTENKTWVIHPTKTQLDDKEIALGYYGPLHDLFEVVNNIAQSGDRILVYDGQYAENDQSLQVNKKLEIIGVGGYVHVEIEFDDIRVDEDIYFKNVTLKLGSCLSINGYYTTTLWMENCQIQFNRSWIEVDGSGTLNAKNCTFSDTHSGSAISVSPNSDDQLSVSIIGCTFTNFKDTCILINGEEFDDEELNLVYVDRINAYLRCVGNVFKNNERYSIAGRTLEWTNISYVIEHNILEGYNGVKVGNIKSANKIYDDDSNCCSM